MDVLAHLGLEVGLRPARRPSAFLSTSMTAWDLTDPPVISSNRLAVRRRRTQQKGAEEPVLGRLRLAIGHGSF